jgi:hypothetical protein
VSVVKQKQLPPTQELAPVSTSQKLVPLQVSAKGGARVVVEVVVEVVVVEVVVDVVDVVVVVVGSPAHRRCRVMGSGGLQMPEQQLAFSRQSCPPVRQAMASTSRNPTRPNAPATSPPSSRRREPD